MPGCRCPSTCACCSTTVHRAYGDLKVNCDKDGHEPGVASAKSTTKALAAGNILFGGVIGAGVDVATRGAYDYPELITVVLASVAKQEAPASAVEFPAAAPASTGTPKAE